jgi:hypothetical protein
VTRVNEVVSTEKIWEEGLLQKDEQRLKLEKVILIE